MARYFFDVHTDIALVRDREGGDFDGSVAIRTEAMHMLPEIARDRIPEDGDKQAFTVLVRDENNVTIYTATLTFAGLWLGDVPILETDD